MTAVARGALLEPGSPCSTRPGTWRLLQKGGEEASRSWYDASRSMQVNLTSLNCVTACDQLPLDSRLALCTAMQCMRLAVSAS
jgi:hypothetical protein